MYNVQASYFQQHTAAFVAPNSLHSSHTHAYTSTRKKTKTKSAMLSQCDAHINARIKSDRLR